jgi:hypothetical protein
VRVLAHLRHKVSWYSQQCCGVKASSTRALPPGGSGRSALTMLKAPAVGSSGCARSDATSGPAVRTWHVGQ